MCEGSLRGQRGCARSWQAQVARPLQGQWEGSHILGPAGSYSSPLTQPWDSGEIKPGLEHVGQVSTNRSFAFPRPWGLVEKRARDPGEPMGGQELGGAGGSLL